MNKPPFLPGEVVRFFEGPRTYLVIAVIPLSDMNDYRIVTLSEREGVRSSHSSWYKKLP